MWLGAETLWDDVSGWLGNGSIIVCKAKEQGGEQQEAGPSGLVRGLQYSVIDVKKVRRREERSVPT